MSAPSFISSRLSFKGHAALWSIAVSFIVVIVAVSIASGFRKGISDALSDMAGDIRISVVGNGSDVAVPFNVSDELLAGIREIDGVDFLRSAVYAGGIVKYGDNIHGVVFKGVETGDSASMNVSIPRSLSTLLSIGEGDSFLAYFIADRVTVRKFSVRGVYDAISTGDDRMVVLCDIATLRRVGGIPDGAVSSLEVVLKPECRDEESACSACAGISALLYMNSQEDAPTLVATSTMDEYRRIFDWLRLIDSNVAFILVLMIIVAGLNMISGLLILLFENISTIGLLKSLGMTTRDVAQTFLMTSSRLVFCGMALGNVIGIVLCLIQQRLKIIRLDASNYFLNYLPVEPDLAMIAVFDLVVFVSIMLVLLIPCTFISKVDPSQTSRVK